MKGNRGVRMSHVDAAESSASTATPGRVRLAGVRLDSQLLERAVLAHGLGSLRLSPLTFVADTSTADGELGFHGTAATTTSKVGREIAGDAQRRRSALQVAGVPVPVGRVFEPDEVEEAIHYAEGVHFPVTVKPASRRRGGVATNLSGVAAVAAALAELHRSKYANRRFVVEQYVVGVSHRVLVIGDRAVSVLRCSDRRDVTDEVDAAVTDIAVRAVAAVPGLDHGGVDVVVDDGAAVVVEMDASPPLAEHEAPAAGPGRAVTAELVRSRLASPPEPLGGDSPVRVDMMLYGMPEPDLVAAKLSWLADELGLNAELGADGCLSAEIEGPLDAVSRMPALMAAEGIGPEIIETSAPVSRASTAAA